MKDNAVLYLYRGAAIASILLATLCTLARVSGYPLVEPEFLMAVGLILVFAFLIAIPLSSLPFIFSALTVSLLSALSANALLRPFPSLGMFDVLGLFTIPAFIFVVIFIVCYLLKLNIFSIFTTVFLALLLGSFFTKPGPLQWSNEVLDAAVERSDALPPYVHIVLDGHSGFSVLEKSIYDNDARIATQVNGFVDRGFKLYSSVRVHDEHTVASFSDFLNFSHSESGSVGAKNNAISKPKLRNSLLKQNDLFIKLKESGYKITVLQTTHLNLCEPQDNTPVVSECFTYPFAALMANLQNANLSVIQKSILMVNQIFVRGGLASAFNRVAKSEVGQKYGFPGWPIKVCLNCIASHTALDMIAPRIINAKHGEAFFIHLITPHPPYQNYDEICRPDFSLDWVPLKTENLMNSYIRQTECVQSTVFQLVDNIAITSPNATVVIHGDHGPRFPDMNITKRKSIVGGYDHSDLPLLTFFASRGPSFESGYDLNMHAVKSMVFKALDTHNSSSITD